MLVLSRKENQRVFIGDEIVITILRSRGNAIRLGIEAPADVQIQREELRYREENPPDEPLVRVA